MARKKGSARSAKVSAKPTTKASAKPASAKLSGDGGEPEGASYYDWTPSMSVGRGLVMAVRGLRVGNNDRTVIAELRAGMVG